MPATSRFFITDVFGFAKYTGNQLATFLNGEVFSTAEMQSIAREINFSETTFLMSRDENKGGYPVRIFTPGGEVDFAGHPTLGTAFLVREHVIGQPVASVTLNLKAGAIPVSFPETGQKDGILWMRQLEPKFGDPLDTALMARVLGLQDEDLDTRWPVLPVSTGLPFTIVPLRSLEALKRATVNMNWFKLFAATSWANGILVFCPEGHTPAENFAVRVFVPHLGVPEDPATGSGNGCLAGYLIRQRYLGTDRIEVCAGQGYEINRPSQLYLRAWEDDGKIGIEVGGKVIPVAEGVWG